MEEDYLEDGWIHLMNFRNKSHVQEERRLQKCSINQAARHLFKQALYPAGTLTAAVEGYTMAVIALKVGADATVSW